MVKGKKINEEVLKKLKPIELVKKNKVEKKEKADSASNFDGSIKTLAKSKALETPKEEKAPEENLTGSTFVDNSIWQTKSFVAPSITRSEAEPTSLERTAEESPVQNQGDKNIKETGINYSSASKSESSAYRISSNYEGKTSYESGRTGEEVRQTMGLGNEHRRTDLTNPFIRPEEIQRSELENFSRLEEQRRIEREESEKLPFMQKRRREEIF